MAFEGPIENSLRTTTRLIAKAGMDSEDSMQNSISECSTAEDSSTTTTAPYVFGSYAKRINHSTSISQTLESISMT